MRLCMSYTDRLGLLRDIAQVMVIWECNIVSVKVDATDTGVIYLECQLASKEQKPQVIQALQQVDGICRVNEVPSIPSQQRAEQLAALVAAREETAATNEIPAYQTLEERLGEVERDILQAAMRKFRSSRQLGAALGLSHTAVLKKLKKYGLRSGGC
ncbi:TyrR/PhhR family helix-turn-helix DNA-binding protein [Acetonema longum]|uniref:Transcriptional regulator n=1 Tax=Acetonema longum DSM 6540 TaxID=1009370 RepID=F7NIN9_9FIRM|nr:TyrR/PhhR family helix-turn-helix DNA-binding protein [Acetonema longum]EGO64103.1 transcriptional regulator [Acetonema longum DSM 6540]